MGGNVCITGGRDYDDRDRVAAELSALEPDCLIVGCCPTGADEHAKRWAADNGVWIEMFEADWAKYGRRAGPLRNEAMVKFAKEKEAVCLVFPGGRGTADCHRRMLDAGLDVTVVTPTSDVGQTQ